MLTCFGDDSADETKQRVFAVAGVFAGDEVWGPLVDQWTTRTGGILFHATDCDSDQGDYAKRDHHQNKNLYRDLTQLLAASGVFGFGVALDICGFKAVYSDLRDEMIYLKAFLETILYISQRATNDFSDSVKFTFDCRTESNYPAGLLYHILVNDASAMKNGPQLFEEVSFLSPRNQPRIQIGDLYAREVMKELDNRVGPVKRPRRKSMDVLEKTKRFGCELWTQESFIRMRAQTAELEQNDQRFNPRTYQQWLCDNSLVDSISNRFKFVSIVRSYDRPERNI